MKKKIALVLFALLTGIILGGGIVSIIYRPVSPPVKVIYREPQISGKIFGASKAFAKIVASVSPVVINISTTKTVDKESRFRIDDQFFDLFSPFRETPRRWKEQSLGSGVIVSEDGYIITNYHVIEHAEEIKVTLYDKRTFRGRIVGTDPKTDIALIKIDEGNLPSIPWTDSGDLQVGEFVLAIGNPFGLNHTVTMGIVSAVGRANVGISDYEDFIQTDAAINPGNSGGPLVNINGELIGINTAMLSRSGGYQGVGFAVPSNMARGIMSQLREKGKVIRGWIGVTIQDLTPELARKFGLDKAAGALVSNIFKESPAEKAGIMRGDVIVGFGGKEVSSVSSLRNAVAQSSINSSVKIRLIREGDGKSLTVRIAELPKEFSEVPSALSDDAPGIETSTGLTVTDLTASIARQLEIKQSEKGVVVVDVEPGSPGHSAGIKKGDLIQEVDRKQITGVADWEEAVSGFASDEMIVLFINRPGRKFYVALKP